MFGYLYAKKDRSVISVVPELIKVVGDEATGSMVSISGIPSKDNELVGFIVSSQEFKEEDKLPADLEDEIDAVTKPSSDAARIEQMEKDIKTAQSALLAARAETNTVLTAVAALFEMLVPIPDPVDAEDEPTQA